MTLFVNLGQKRRLPQEVEFTVWPIGITLVAYPSLILLIVVSVAILALLPEQLTIEFEKYNLNPGWNPEHTLLFIAWQSFVMIWIVQLAGLVWLWRFRGPYRLQRSAGRLGQIAGIMGILLIAALYWVNPEGTRYFGGNLIMSILTFFVAGRQLVRLPSTKHDAYRLPSRLSWLAGFAGGGLLSATFMHQFAASAFSLVQLDVSMMDVLQNETAPPPGLIWLEKSFHELFVAQADFYLLFLTGGILIGLGIGWAFAIWAPKRPLP